MIKNRSEIITGTRCNNSCSFCYFRINNQRLEEKTTEELINLIDKAESLNIDKIVLTGGEVTIRNDFKKIIEYLHTKNFKHIELPTNGRVFSDKNMAKWICDFDR